MDAFKTRLTQYVTIAGEVTDTLAAVAESEESVEAGLDIVRAGSAARKIHIIQSGWAARYRMIEDGRRQIVNFMLPGDVFDLQALGDLDADHSVAAVTNVDVTSFDAARFLSALRRSGDVASAFWWTAVQEESILREQVVRVGRLSARERIGHMLLELRRRWGGAMGESVLDLPLPLTRTDLADALGLTPIHVSRTMSQLKQDGMIKETRDSIRILDRDRLARLSQFDPDYLHIRKLAFADRQSSESQRELAGTK